MKRKFLASAAITVLLALVVQIAGCDMNTYNYYDGLVLHTEREIKIINEPIRNTAGYPIPGYPRMITPRLFDIGLATAKGLAATCEFSEKYLYMQAVYRKSLDAYLVKALNLVEYDNHFAGYSYSMIPMAKTKQNYYHRHSMMGLTYLYLRNNICIERLSLEDLALLEERYVNNQTDITPEIQTMVERTYIAVMKNMSDEELAAAGMTDETEYMLFGGGARLKNTTIVLEYAYDYIDTVSTEELISTDAYFREEYTRKTEEELSNKLDVPVRIFEGEINYFDLDPNASDKTPMSDRFFVTPIPDEGAKTKAKDTSDSPTK